MAFEAGQTVFAQGQPGDVMYAVIEGQVEIVKDGKVLESIGPGGIFGEMALIDPEPRSAAAIARTDCRLTTINARRFLQLVQQTPYFSLDVMRLLVLRLRRKP